MDRLLKIARSATPQSGVQFREAACWAHLRRDFHDIWKTTNSPIAKDALERIGTLYDIEREITGQSAEARRDVRQQRGRPHVQAFRTWCENHLARIPAKGDLAKAMRYALNRWPAFMLFLGIVGGLVYWRTEALWISVSLWLGGATMCAAYYAIRPLRRPMYLGWMYMVYPIGWVISHLLFGAIFYFVMTPIGALMRISGRDPLERRFESDEPTYWVPRQSRVDAARYFRQF